MPGEPLSDADPPAEGAAPFEGYAGFFGKMPAAGDFVTRGLAPELRARWDGWVTRHLARWEGPWPEGGLRLLLPSGSRALLAVVLPSEDRVGRRFPLAALAVLPETPSHREAEAWCDAAAGPLAAAVEGRLDPDSLIEALAGLPGPERQRTDPVVWSVGLAPVPLDPADPAGALAALSCRGSSIP